MQRAFFFFFSFPRGQEPVKTSPGRLSLAVFPLREHQSSRTIFAGEEMFTANEMAMCEVTDVGDSPHKHLTLAGDRIKVRARIWTRFDAFY